MTGQRFPELDSGALAAGQQRLRRLLRACVAADASDLHLVVGAAPCLRCHGVLEPVADEGTLSHEAVAAMAQALLSDAAEAEYKRRGSADGAMSDETGVRFRFNVFQRQGQVSVALRRLEDAFRPLRELGLPESLYELSDLPDGLVLVAGPTGAGKSTTLATLLDRVNETRPCHIITIEDPVEYLHRPKRALINQRQIGLDAPDFNDALVASLRQDPDVILVGEIRDLATIRTAITAAETGHLVFASVHASDAPSTLERLTAVFPPGEQDGIRKQLGLTLRAVVSQHLLVADGPKAGQTSGSRRPRVAVSEILRITPAVANLIATGKTNQIYSAMEAGASQGMQTLEEDLARLLVAGQISEPTAQAMARSPKLVEDRTTRLRSRGGATGATGAAGARVSARDSARGNGRGATR